MNIPSLITRKGDLCYPNGEPVYLFLPTGDVRTFDWPGDFLFSDLREALYDARETGEIGDVRQVTLPDGMTFDIDQ
jgi:hypothetical protein